MTGFVMKTFRERFDAFLPKPLPPADECWLWQGYCTLAGYGTIANTAGQLPAMQRAHRLSWEFAHGPIPDGLLVLHDCPGGDNPACCNPAHLWLGTDADNRQDQIAKARDGFLSVMD